MVSNRPSAPTATAVSSGCTRTRCWSRRGRAVGVELALLDLQQGRVHVVHPGVREQLRAPAGQQRDLVGDADARTGRSRRPTPRSPRRAQARRPARSGSVFMAAATLATSTASAAARAAAAAVRSTAEAKPQVPSTTTRTARPRSSLSNWVSRLPSDRPICWPADPLGAEVGVPGAEVGRPLQRRVGQLAQRVGGEFRVDPTGSGWVFHKRNLSQARRRGAARYARHDQACVPSQDAEVSPRDEPIRTGHRRQPGHRPGDRPRLAAGGRRRDRHLQVRRAGAGLTVAACDVRDAAAGRRRVQGGRGGARARSRCWWPTPGSPGTSCSR